MTDNDVEIGRLVGQSLRQAMQQNQDRLEQSIERLLTRLQPPTHNGNGASQPMVVNTGGGQPAFTFDYRAFSEALASALTPTFNAQREQADKIETLIEQVAQLTQAIAGMEIRPTINVPQSAVNVELPAPKGFTVTHDDGTKSRITVE